MSFLAKLLLWCFCCLLATGAQATYKPTGNEDPATKAWFKNARLTQAAYKRLGWYGCCDNADRFVTKFESVKSANGYDEEWYYYNEKGEKTLIPADTIHHEDDPTMPAQLKAEGVLFVIQGTVGCFWPPQSGI